MKNKNRSDIIKMRLVLLGFLSLFFIMYQKVVFGYAFDSTFRTDCAYCHSIRKSKTKAGTWAIRKDVIRELDSSELDSSGNGKPYQWACDVCHQSRNTNKLFDFSASDTSIMPGGTQDYKTSFRYPSTHPVPVSGKNFRQIKEEYVYALDSTDTANIVMGGRVRSVMYCTNCHDPLQVGRGIHKTYVSIYRLRFSGKDTAGVEHFDPDPADDTVFLGSDSTSWFWTRPFYDTSVRGVLKFELIPHQGSSSFNPKNSRAANKELTDFNTLGLKSIYFCVTCHDINGFPQDPMDTVTAVMDISNKRIRPMDFAEGLYGYDPSDAADSVYTPSDGGHTIQSRDTTNNGLITGDKLSCVSCHESHSSRASRKLLKESFSEGTDGFEGGFGNAVKDGIEKRFCLRCHNPTDDTYYTNGLFYKSGASIQSKMLPTSDSKGRAITSAHSANENGGQTCYSFIPQDQQDYYWNGGCHKDPHRPTMFCNACHQSHYEKPETGTKTTHPVGVMLSATPIAGDTMSIKDYYMQYGDTLEVPIFGGANGYYNGYIDCYTCHNDHSATNSLETAYAPQMQALLRGDAGPTVIANFESVKLGVGNNYPNHNTNYNARLQNLATSGGGMSVSDFQSLGAMPELCINCHFRVVGVKYNHGGFATGGFGRCDKCHSMHGQHPEPAKDAPLDSTCLVRPLRYGMYLGYDTITTFNELNSNTTNLYINAAADNKAYTTTKIEFDSTGAFKSYDKYVWKDANNLWFSNHKNDHLLQEALQRDLCSKCHGNENWNNLVETTGGQKAPPQIFFDAAGTVPRMDSLDMYYTSYVFESSDQKNRSTHPVDLAGQKAPGHSQGDLLPLKCSSGSKGAGCHNPHGNSNYAQLNVMVMSASNFGSAVVPYTTVGAYTTRAYVSGMSTFCSLCHDLFANGIYDSTSPYDPVKGRYNYTRHPVGSGVSLLTLYDSADRGQMNSAFFNNLVLDYDTTAYPNGHPDYNDFLNADTAEAAKNFIVTCVTCHRQHGSPNLHLRKFTDTAVIECVGCHGRSPDILK